MIRKTYYEKKLCDYFSKISDKVLLDTDNFITNNVLPYQQLLQTRAGKCNRSCYNLKFFKDDFGHFDAYLTVIRKNRVTGYYFINISVNDDYLDINDFIFNVSVVGNGKNCFFLQRVCE